MNEKEKSNPLFDEILQLQIAAQKYDALRITCQTYLNGCEKLVMTSAMNGEAIDWFVRFEETIKRIENA